jgi:hypothetical protein
MGSNTKEDNKEVYRKEISVQINSLYKDFSEIIKKTEISEDDQSKLNNIHSIITKISGQNKVVKEIPTVYIVKLNQMINSFKELQHIFSFNSKDSFTPYRGVSNTYSDNEGKNLIIKNFSSGVGTSKLTYGIVDDVTNFINSPIISVGKQSGNKNNGGFIHQLDIKSEYRVSFEFTLNRFPSKTYQHSDNKYSMKQLTSRRTDLITFEYEDDGNSPVNVIEFGAMAPFGLFFDSEYKFEFGDEIKSPKSEKKRDKITTLRDLIPQLTYEPYKNNYSPFSIGASINCGNNYRVSISTDYKFELGKSYTVTLIINNLGGVNFGDEQDYDFRMEVNMIPELIVASPGKVWGNTGSRNRDNNTIHSQPNFRKRLLPKAVNEDPTIVDRMIRDSYTVRTKESFQINLKKLRLSTLKSINTVPYIKNGAKNNKIYNHMNYKTNNGVIFKTIDIYYM